MNRLKSTVAVFAMALSTTLLAQPHQFPAPTTVSETMAAAVAAPVANLWIKAPKSVSDWQAIASEYAETVGQSALNQAKALDVDVQTTQIASVNVNVLTPKSIDQGKADKIIFYIHGGGYVRLCRWHQTITTKSFALIIGWLPNFRFLLQSMMRLQSIKNW